MDLAKVSRVLVEECAWQPACLIPLVSRAWEVSARLIWISMNAACGSLDVEPRQQEVVAPLRDVKVTGSTRCSRLTSHSTKICSQAKLTHWNAFRSRVFTNTKTLQQLTRPKTRRTSSREALPAVTSTRRQATRVRAELCQVSLKLTHMVSIFSNSQRETTKMPTIANVSLTTCLT